MEDILAKFIEQSEEVKTICKPIIYRLKKPEDQERFEKLIRNTPGLRVLDEIQGQIEELIKARNPKIDFPKATLAEKAYQHLHKKNAPEEYGAWVYYPWLNKVLHILDNEEFVEVRTNRNQYKITPEEREILSKKKIGVIGLSVGQTVALTLAQERTFGELRIADFDILELSNLNRIRTGVQNLGIKKTLLVAREIAEIDPYLNVVCYDEGITEDNIDNFLLRNGKLDLLIDECDSVDVKILCRQKAKQNGVPVVMEASDRGTIDIERFDLENNRPILHGFVEHLDLSALKFLRTSEEKLPYIMPIFGIETVSKRAKASMLEVGSSITTWPQLASSVVLGGGLTADVSRRILLDELHISGRFFIDLEELINDKNETKIEDRSLKLGSPLSDQEVLSLIKTANTNVKQNQLDLKEETVKDLVNAAIASPTGANAQPWKWVYHNKNLYLFFDLVYTAHLLDFEGTTSYIGLGASYENLVLRAHALGLEVETVKFPIKDNYKLISIFKFFNKKSDHNAANFEDHSCDFLEGSIYNRVSNRKIVKRQPIEKSVQQHLIEIARTVPGANLQFIDDEKGLYELGEIVAKVDRIRIMHNGGHYDFMAEMRWTTEQAEATKNGVDINIIDMTPTEKVGFEIAKDWSTIELLNKWKKGTGLEKFSRKSSKSASAIGLITMSEFSPIGFLNGGIAMEKVWLAATHKNIAFQPITISTLIFNTFLHEEENIFPESMRSELELLRKKFTEIFTINEKAAEIMLFRIFIADPPAAKSLRVPVDKVLSFMSE